MTIEDLIKEQIEQLDIKELVRIEIRNMISDDVKREIRKVTTDETKAIIRTEIEKVMAKGVQTDDGWGKKEIYKSFEEMFKKTFAEQLNSKYEIQKVVQEYVKAEVTKLVNERTKDIVSALKTQLGA